MGAGRPPGQALSAARHAVGEFLDGELERRAELGYPPYRRLVRLLGHGAGYGHRPGRREALEAAARPVLDGDALLGPAPRSAGSATAPAAACCEKTLDPRRTAVVFRGLLRDLAPDMRRPDATAVVDVDPQFDLGACTGSAGRVVVRVHAGDGRHPRAVARSARTSQRDPRPPGGRLRLRRPSDTIRTSAITHPEASQAPLQMAQFLRNRAASAGARRRAP